jgi:hypothetical protein
MDVQVLGMGALYEANRADRAQDRYLTDVGLNRDGSLIDPQRPLRRIAPPPNAWTVIGAALVAMIRRPPIVKSAE